MLPATPVVKDVVLLGGGHSHVEVMRSFGMKPVPGARLTLITKDVQTPYSGMLPGYVSGFYSYEDTHIDLQRLARFARCRLIHAEAIGLDTKSRKVMMQGRPPMKYDVLSIDIGSSPDGGSVPGAREFTTAVKPISTFITRLHALLESVKEEDATLSRQSSAKSEAQSSKEIRAISRRSSALRHVGDRGFCVVVVGGGAGGVELSFAMKYRLLKEAEDTNRSCISEPVIKIVTGRQILEGYPSAVRDAVLKLFKQKGIEVYENSPVTEVKEGCVTLRSGAVINFDGCLWCTQASAASWIQSTTLTTDEKGFIKINDFLQAFNGPAEVFAAGDVATSVNNPRPKAGVFAVRQGPPLAANIRRFLQGEELLPFTPQSLYLSLISTGDKSAVASKGWLFWQGPSMWRLKDNIDRSFMYKYSRDLPDMENMQQEASLDERTASNLLEKQAAILSDRSRMRCAGCGGKVGMRVLQNVLAAIQSSENAPVTGAVYDDAAILPVPAQGHILLQTTDFLRSFISDPYLFGQITALHCLSDIFAMGGQPLTLLATAVVPFATEEKMEADLTQVLLGAKKVCDDINCDIVGGHTAEGLELSLGFSVTGSVPAKKILKKHGAKLDQSIILTKPLGTGMILAAEMRGKAKASWIKAAVDSMLISNGPAARIFHDCGATACTDVTGFGLLGHLKEMLMHGKVSVELSMQDIPLLTGSAVCVRSGWLSSLHPQNKRVEDIVDDFERIKYGWELPVMVDPQTSGGLLAFVPNHHADQCIEALHLAGLKSAAIIGQTVEMIQSATPKIYIRQSGDPESS